MRAPTTARERLADARLYLCTDARRDTGDLATFAEKVLSGGVDVIQLRDKGSAGEAQFGPLEAKEELAALAVLAAACRRHGALLAVNDRADIAYASGADILHLGQGDLPVPHARRIVGPQTLIGRSTHSRAQATFAETEDGVDYFACGPVWPTATKPGRSAAGIDTVREVAESHPTRPWFAIGGIDLDNVDTVRAAGATRICVVRALTRARDPHAAAQELAAAIRR